MPPLKHTSKLHPTASLPDLTRVRTIYYRSLQTVRVRIRRDYAAAAEPAQITGPDEVYPVLRSLFATLDDDQEHFLLLVLNRAHHITGYKLLCSGAQDRVSVDSKIAFRNALLLGAHRLVVAHNHPSGTLAPSEQDWDLTRKLVQAGRLLDIRVLDHIIYTRRGCTSLQGQQPRLFGE